NAAYCGLDVAALVDLGVVGQGAPGLHRIADPAEKGDPVPTPLPVPDRAIAERLDRCLRKGLIGTFELLEADDVGLKLLQPAREDVQAGIDPVDIAARDPQA